MHSTVRATYCSWSANCSYKLCLLLPSRAMTATVQDMGSPVRTKLIEAFSNGRQRMAKPIVLPVVDRPGPPAAQGLEVEELELCRYCKKCPACASALNAAHTPSTALLLCSYLQPNSKRTRWRHRIVGPRSYCLHNPVSFLVAGPVFESIRAPDGVSKAMCLCDSCFEYNRSEPDHPHGQGWVPLRIMYRKQPLTPAAVHPHPAAVVPRLQPSPMPLERPAHVSQQAPCPTPAVTAALNTTMAVTSSSIDAARAVLMHASPSAPAAGDAAATQGAWAGRQHTTPLPPSFDDTPADSACDSRDAAQAHCVLAGASRDRDTMSEGQTGSGRGTKNGGQADSGRDTGSGCVSQSGLPQASPEAASEDISLGLGVDADPFSTPAARRELSVVDEGPADSDTASASNTAGARDTAVSNNKTDVNSTAGTSDTVGAGLVLNALSGGAPKLPPPSLQLCHASPPLPGAAEEQPVSPQAVQQVHQKLNSCSVANADQKESTKIGSDGQAQQTYEKLPVVILLHSTGSDMGRMRSEQEACARAGYLAVAIDCRYHGARCVVEHEGQHKRDMYQNALVRAWREGKERPFLLDNLWDLSHVLDYLVTRPDVDAQRIGITGVSLGGMHAWLLAVADDRIAVTAPMIGVQSFGWAVHNKQWHARVDSVPKGFPDGVMHGIDTTWSLQVFEAAAADLCKQAVDAEVVQAVWDKLLPGLLEAYDAHLSLPTIAPRPLLVANAELDARCPMPGVLAAMKAAHAAYMGYYMTHLAGPVACIHDGPSQADVVSSSADDASSVEWGSMCSQSSSSAAAITTPSLTAPSAAAAAATTTTPSSIAPSAATPELQGSSGRMVQNGAQGLQPNGAQGPQQNGHSTTLNNEASRTSPHDGDSATSTRSCDGVNEAFRESCGLKDVQVAVESTSNTGDAADSKAAESVTAQAAAAAAARAALLERARAWAAFRCALYVEPSAGHEERPGKWAAVRAFLDLHLRGVGRTTAYAAALKKNVVELGHTHTV